MIASIHGPAPRRRRLTAHQLDNLNSPGADGAAEFMARRAADRVHVHAPARAVVRAVNRAFSAPYRRAHAARRVRRAAYVAALAQHAENRALARMVAWGALESRKGHFLEAARLELAADLARYRNPNPGA